VRGIVRHAICARVLRGAGGGRAGSGAAQGAFSRRSRPPTPTLVFWKRGSSGFRRSTPRRCPIHSATMRSGSSPTGKNQVVMDFPRLVATVRPSWKTWPCSRSTCWNFDRCHGAVSSASQDYEGDQRAVAYFNIGREGHRGEDVSNLLQGRHLSSTFHFCDGWDPGHLLPRRLPPSATGAGPPPQTV
jgi:hypothetical protein